MQNTEVTRIENLKWNRDTFYIQWRVTSACNYQCDFCIQGDRKKHIELAKEESVGTREKVCNAIISYIEALKDYSSISVSLIGGEVTILKDLHSLLERLVNVRFPGDISFHITTNFSQSADYYCKMFDIFHVYNRREKRRSLHLATSYYSVYVTQKEFEQKLLHVKRHIRRLCVPDYMKALLKNGLKTRPAQTMSLAAGFPILNDEDYEKFKNMRDSFRGKGVWVSPIYIRQYPTDIKKNTLDNLLEEQREKNLRVTDIYGHTKLFQNIQALGMEMDQSDRFNPSGFLCDAGINSMWINAFGDVYRCPAIGSSMKIGNILDGSYEGLNEMAVCTADHCSCNKFGLISR